MLVQELMPSFQTVGQSRNYKTFTNPFDPLHAKCQTDIMNWIVTFQKMKGYVCMTNKCTAQATWCENLTLIVIHVTVQCKPSASSSIISCFCLSCDSYA